jgi:hypothetical protein
VGTQDVTAASNDLPGIAPPIRKPSKIRAFAAIVDLP